MLSISPATRIFVALEPADLRQSFNGLQGRVQSCNRILWPATYFYSPTNIAID
jgi:hypothetical protein